MVLVFVGQLSVSDVVRPCLAGAFRGDGKALDSRKVRDGLCATSAVNPDESVTSSLLSRQLWGPLSSPLRSELDRVRPVLEGNPAGVPRLLVSRVSEMDGSAVAMGGGCCGARKGDCMLS
jgi:hypothetical protein